MKNGQIKLQNEEGLVAMLYTEIPNGIQVAQITTMEHLIDFIKNAAVDMILDGGKKAAGLANDTGRVMFK